MLTMRGVLAVLLLTAAGCSSPSNTATPASAAATAKTGTVVINPRLDFASSFSDGLARVRIGDKWGFIDEDKTTELTGTIKEFQFTNPHSWIQVVGASKPGEAPKEWSIEWGSPNQLSRQGIRPSTFKVGAKVTMRVHPMRDGSAAGNFVAAKFDDGKTVGRWEQ